MIVRGMVTQSLVLEIGDTSLLKLHSTFLFRQLQGLDIRTVYDLEINFVSYLEQVKQLKITGGTFPANVLNTHLPLVHTLQHLDLKWSTFSWMLGRTFKALKQVDLYDNRSEELSAHKGLRVDLPACTTFKSILHSVVHFDFFSSPNLQALVWEEISGPRIHNEAFSKPLQNFLLCCPYLQQLEVVIYHHSELDSLFQFVFYDAREQGVWQDIRSVKLTVGFTQFADRIPFFNQILGHQQHYRESWREFTVTNEKRNRWRDDVIIRASA